MGDYFPSVTQLGPGPESPGAEGGGSAPPGLTLRSSFPQGSRPSTCGARPVLGGALPLLMPGAHAEGTTVPG